MAHHSELRIISVNVGLPQTIRWRDRLVSTAIFKSPVEGRVAVGRLNVAGDRQADPTVHGGADKAVYCYAAEHYAVWKEELGRTDLPWGMFGENLTIEGGFTEDAICVGDRFRAGTAEFMAVQPRLPCYKLGIRFGSQQMISRFARSHRFGIYCRVMQEGEVGAGDVLEFTSRVAGGVSIGDLGRLIIGESEDLRLVERAVAAEALPERLREHFRDLFG